MSRANRTRPRVAMMMAKHISPIYVLVARFCPRELKRIIFISSVPEILTRENVRIINLVLTEI